MKLLSTQKIEIVTSTADTIHVVAGWADIDKTAATTYTPGTLDTSIGAATSTVVVDAPSTSSIYREVTDLSIRNEGAGTNTIRVQRDTGGVEIVIESIALAPGESLRFETRTGWDRYTALGERMVSGRDGTNGATGAAGVGTSGTAELDFGTWPGSAHATVDVTGQATITGTSATEAWILPAATADHTADEHIVERIAVVAGPATAGVGFTIHGILPDRPGPAIDRIALRNAGGRSNVPPTPVSPHKRARLYGRWSVAWRWS